MKKLLVLIIAIVLCSVFTTPAFATTYPQPTGYINDYTNTLSQSFIKQEEKKLADFQKATTDEIAVVVINSTNGDPIEDYSIHLMDQWKVGVKGKDNGVLLLLALQDRKLRIEVGRGLEGGTLSDPNHHITDIQARDIEDSMIPYLKNSDYPTAIDAGVSGIMTDIANPSATTSAATTDTSTNNDPTPIIIIALIIIFIVIFVVAVGFNAPDDSSGTGFATGAMLGGFAGYGMGRSSKSSDDDDDDSSSGGFSGGSSSTKSDDDDDSSSGGGSSFGGFSGGSFSGGGATSSW